MSEHPRLSLSEWRDNQYRLAGRTISMDPVIASLLECLPDDLAELNILDLGAGWGRHALYLASLGARVTAMDRSEIELRKLRRSARKLPANGRSRIAYVQGDISEGLPKGSFDAVLMFYVLHHLDSEKVLRVLRKAKEVTKPGGWAVVVTHMSTSLDHHHVSPFNGLWFPADTNFATGALNFTGWNSRFYGVSPAVQAQVSSADWLNGAGEQLRVCRVLAQKPH